MTASTALEQTLLMLETAGYVPSITEHFPFYAFGSKYENGTRIEVAVGVDGEWWQTITYFFDGEGTLRGMGTCHVPREPDEVLRRGRPVAYFLKMGSFVAPASLRLHSFVPAPK